MVRRHDAAIACAVVLTLACGGDEGSPSAAGSSSSGESGAPGSTSTIAASSSGDDTSGSSSGDGTTGDAVDTSGTTGEAPPGLPAIGPTMGTMPLNFRVAVSGMGSLFVGAIEIVDDVGTIEIDGETQPLFVYERQPWPSQGYTLYQALAVDDDGWTVLWFYCDDTGLSSIYLESTDGIPLQTIFAEGTCEVALESVQAEVELPGTEFDVVYNGEPFSIDGPEISVEAGMLGEVEIDGVPFVVAPFETVDCSMGCGMIGWYEVHVLLWDPVLFRACFAILYFEVDGAVRMTYGVTLPDLVDVVQDTMFLADWVYG